MQIEELKDLCSKFRSALYGDFALGLKTYKQTQDLADVAMIAALQLEQRLSLTLVSHNEHSR